MYVYTKYCRTLGCCVNPITMVTLREHYYETACRIFACGDITFIPFPTPPPPLPSSSLPRRHGYFSGINRKVQFKLIPRRPSDRRTFAALTPPPDGGVIGACEGVEEGSWGMHGGFRRGHGKGRGASKGNMERGGGLLKETWKGAGCF